MSTLFTVRQAVAADVEALRYLIDEFARGHRAESHPRPISAMHEAYFGAYPLVRLFLAEREGAPIGFGGWRRVFDMFWAMHGGDAEGLYVKPHFRGQGVAPALIAAICADIRGQGGEFLRASYSGSVSRLYERVAIAAVNRECHLSALAFQKMADLAGSRPRDLLRGLPAKHLNFESR